MWSTHSRRIDPPRVLGSYRRFLAKRIYAESCDPTPAIITTSELIVPWRKTLRRFARFSRPDSSGHARYSADFIINIAEFEFSTGTTEGTIR